MLLFAVAHAVQLEDGTYAVRSPEFPGCEARSAHVEVAREQFGDADPSGNRRATIVQELGGGPNTQRRVLSGRRQIQTLPSGLGVASLNGMNSMPLTTQPRPVLAI